MMFRKKNVVPDVDTEKPLKEDEKEVVEEKQQASTEVEMARIKAKLEALTEAREANSERFGNINEQMGEMRSMIVSQDKNIKELEVSARKASDLVEQVQPQALLTEVSKVESKINTMSARVDGDENLIRNLISEIKEIRSKMGVYQGSDQILKLNRDVKNDLIDMQKMRTILEGHADKVEKIFIEVQKNFNDFKQYESLAKDLSKSYESVLKQIAEFNSKSPTLASKAELRAVKDKVDAKFGLMDKIFAELDRSVFVFQKMNIKDQVVEIQKQNLVLKENLDSLTDFVEKIADNVSGESYDIDSVKKAMSYNNERIERMMRIVELIYHRLGERVGGQR